MTEHHRWATPSKVRVETCSCGETPDFFVINNSGNEDYVDIGFVCGCGNCVELTVHKAHDWGGFVEGLAEEWNKKWQS